MTGESYIENNVQKIIGDCVDVQMELNLPGTELLWTSVVWNKLL